MMETGAIMGEVLAGEAEGLSIANWFETACIERVNQDSS